MERGESDRRNPIALNRYNWAHPGRKNRTDEVDLLDLLLDWVDDETVRDKILTDNPADLYGF